MPCDVTDVMAVDVLFRQVAEVYGGLDIAVLNAGIDAKHIRVEDGTLTVWTQIVEVNRFGAYDCARAAIPLLESCGGGRILMAGSGLGHHGRVQPSAYACSKAGLWMLTCVL